MCPALHVSIHPSVSIYPFLYHATSLSKTTYLSTKQLISVGHSSSYFDTHLYTQQILLVCRILCTFTHFTVVKTVEHGSTEIKISSRIQKSLSTILFFMLILLIGKNCTFFPTYTQQSCWCLTFIAN